MVTNLDISHDLKVNRFTLSGEGGDAILEYRIVEQPGAGQTVDFVHTYVPAALRGRGMAERLVRQGLKWARDEGYQVRASC